MAGKSGGDVAVRFSVEGAETVRTALKNLGSDGQKALAQLDAAAKPVPKSLLAVSEAISEGKNHLQTWSGSLGLAGRALMALGPIGLVAGGVIGGLMLAFGKASRFVDEFAAKMERLDNTATTLGLTTGQLHALREAGERVGVGFDKIETGIGKFTVGMEQLRRGTGDFLAEVRRVDPELARQLAATRDNSEAIEIYTRAWERAGETQRNAMSRAATGRDLAIGRLFGQLGKEGGLLASEAQLKREGELIDQELITRIKTLKVEIEQIKERSSNIWGQIFSEETLRQQKRNEELWLAVAEASAKHLANVKAIRELSLSPGTADFMLPPGLEPASVSAAAAAKPVAKVDSFPARFGAFDIPVPLPQPRPGGAPRREPSPEFKLAELRANVAALGDAATAAEQYRVRVDSLKQQLATNEITQQTYNRAVAAAGVMYAQAIFAARERMGVASSEERMTQRLRDVEDQRARGIFRTTEEYHRARTVAIASVQQEEQNTRARLGLYNEEQEIATRLIDLQNKRAQGVIRSSEEMALAERLMRREVKETADAMRERASTMPQLTRYITESGNAMKQLDGMAVKTLDSASDAFADVVTGAKTMKEAVADLANSVARDLAKMALRQALFGIFGALFGGGKGAGGGDAIGGIFGALFGGGGGGGNAMPAGFGGVGAAPYAMGGVFDSLLSGGGRVIPFASGGIIERPTIFPLARGAALTAETGVEMEIPLTRNGDHT